MSWRSDGRIIVHSLYKLQLHGRWYSLNASICLPCDGCCHNGSNVSRKGNKNHPTLHYALHLWHYAAQPDKRRHDAKHSGHHFSHDIFTNIRSIHCCGQQIINAHVVNKTNFLCTAFWCHYHIMHKCGNE